LKYKFITFALMISFIIVNTGYTSQTYEVDPSHASIGFKIEHLVISKVKGEFRDFTATLVLDDEGLLKEASSNIKVTSIDTGITKRDDHLRSPDFFDVNVYPEISFKSKSVKQGAGNNVLVGNLTIHGVTKEVELPYKIKGPVKGPQGKTRIGFEASTVINRKDYGLTWNMVLEAGGLVVGEELELLIDLEAIKMQVENVKIEEK